MSDMIQLENLINKVKEASDIYASYSQERVDKIFKFVAIAANHARISLAEAAFEETKTGVIEDKVIKNHFACEYVYNKYKNAKTCGIIREDLINGIKTVAEPLGVIAGIIPMTNPTSTVIFKTLIALKTRNGIIFSPHPKAKNCTVKTAKILLEAAVEAGAPENIIGWIPEPTKNLSADLMKNKNIDCILATGGAGMVKTAYSSGTPAIGVSSGNVPVIIDDDADIKTAVSSVILSKTFDNGLICASEQSVIVSENIYEKVKKEFIFRGAHFLSDLEIEKLSEKIFLNGGINPEIVGKSASDIAKIAGFKINDRVKLLIAERLYISSSDYYSYEKLSPVLSMYKAKNLTQAINMSKEIINSGGKGHTAVLYTDEKNTEKISLFASEIKTCRLLINTPSAQGGIGDLYNFVLPPSLTLGCGSWGKNSVSGNIEIKHLLNYKTLSFRRENMLWYKIPPEIYFKRGATQTFLRSLEGVNRAFILTDDFLYKSGRADVVIKILKEKGISIDVFSEIKPEPDILTVNNALHAVKSFAPDCIIAFGGGSPLDAAKIIKVMYEVPDLSFDDVSMRFMDIRKRICSVPRNYKKSVLICIPTTSGTGSEVTPFSIITDEKTHIKYSIADYAFTPDIAIIDPDFVDTMPKNLTAACGIDTLVHSLESYVSVMASDFTNVNSLQAFKSVFKYLERAYKYGEDDLTAREEMHYAATLAGIAFANSFLGLCHSMAHKLGSTFYIPHGISNALLIRQIIKFNATDIPKKQCIFPQYKYPNAKEKYANLADELNLGGTNDDEKVDLLINAISKLMKNIDIPSSVFEYGISQNDFFKNIETMSKLSFDDQCTITNPVYPLIDDIKILYEKAYFGKI